MSFFSSGWVKMLLYLAIGILCFSASILIVLYYFQSFFFYHPNTPSDSREAIRTPDTAGFPIHETITLTSSDGTNLMAYWMPYQHPSNGQYRNQDKKNDKRSIFKRSEMKNKKNWNDKNNGNDIEGNGQNAQSNNIDNDNQERITFLFLQGNAGNIGHRLSKMARLTRYLDCNILMPSYRGYGRSDGSPDEDGISKDAMTAMEYLHGKKEVSRDKIVIWGESFGSSVALDLASRNSKPMAVIMENPYLNLKSKVAARLPWPLKWMSKFLKEKWDNESKMLALVDAASTTGFMPNIMIMTGMQDRNVSPSQGSELAKIAERGRNCTERPEKVRVDLVTFNKGGHLDLAEQVGFYETIKKFLINLK